MALERYDTVERTGVVGDASLEANNRVISLDQPYEIEVRLRRNTA